MFSRRGQVIIDMSIFDCSNEASNVKRKRKAAPRTKQPSHKSATVIDSIPATENQRPMNKWQMNRLSDVVGSADANIIAISYKQCA